MGGWLDQKAMRLTVGFWKRKFRDLDGSTFDLALKSRRGVSKHHPLHFQQKVLARFEENLRAAQKRTAEQG
ncbi:MAG: nucleotidyltransferase domain-containing protein, partial [Saprospiraceae bacterium]